MRVFTRSQGNPVLIHTNKKAMRKKFQTGLLIVMTLLLSIRLGDQHTRSVNDKTVHLKNPLERNCMPASDSPASSATIHPASTPQVNSHPGRFKGLIPTSPQVVRNWFRLKDDSTHG
jgi:hypothetical protein